MNTKNLGLIATGMALILIPLAGVAACIEEPESYYDSESQENWDIETGEGLEETLPLGATVVFDEDYSTLHLTDAGVPCWVQLDNTQACFFEYAIAATHQGATMEVTE